MCRNDIYYRVCFCGIREGVELQENQSANPKALANDQFAEILIFRDHNAVFSVRDTENILVRHAWSRFCNRDDLETCGAKSSDHKTRDVLVREETHHSAAKTVSCCM